MSRKGGYHLFERSGSAAREDVTRVFPLMCKEDQQLGQVGNVAEAAQPIYQKKGLNSSVSDGALQSLLGVCRTISLPESVVRYKLA